MTAQSTEPTTLSYSIREYLGSREFIRYFLLYMALLTLCEASAGAAFSYLFVRNLEADRKLSFEQAWDNYLAQRWQVNTQKITGYAWWDEAWNHALSGERAALKKLFEDDVSISKEYDYFAVYLGTDKPVVELAPIDPEQRRLPPSIIHRLFQSRSQQKGETHFIGELGDGRTYLISVSCLADYAGKPMIPGIEILAFDLEKFLKLAGEVIPVAFTVTRNPGRTYLTLDLAKHRLDGVPFYIDITPRLRIASLVTAVLAFMIAAQIAISLAIFGVIAPRFARRHTRRLRSMLDESETLNTALARQLNDLSHARTEIVNSEIKYRRLIESTSDIVFSLSPDDRILMINQAVDEHLGRAPSSLIGSRVEDLIYGSDRSLEFLGKAVLREKLALVRETRKGAVFRIDFATRHNEPCNLELRLEPVITEGELLILGKASVAVEDSLLTFCLYERKRYVIGNYLTTAEQVGHRITMNLAGRLPLDDLMGVGVCVREMLINGIEHGNLAITFDEKTRATQEGGYLKFLFARQQDPRFRNLKVTVDYSLRPKRVTYKIKDDGAGFDHKRLLEKASQADGADEGIFHGRGIRMTLQIFDYVRYNEKGNEVLLVKNLGPNVAL